MVMVVSSGLSSSEIPSVESTTGGSVDCGGSEVAESTDVSTGSSIIIGVVVVSLVVESLIGFVVSSDDVVGFFVDVTLESSLSSL